MQCRVLSCKVDKMLHNDLLLLKYDLGQITPHFFADVRFAGGALGDVFTTVHTHRQVTARNKNNVSLFAMANLT